MDFGRAVGTACGSFAVTNIDDMFVLVTFYAEASAGKGLTSLKITIGQYVGFSVIIVISLIWFGASLLFSPEPIGFLGLLPLLLGTWWMFGLLPSKHKEPEPEPESSTAATASRVSTRAPTWVKSIVKVAGITLMNGGDNIGTYIPLFSQAKGAEIAVYIVVYYILLGVWCLAAFLVMKQKHILRVAQKYARIAIPFLYVGLGIFIIVKSKCYPWSIQHIDDAQPSHPGTAILAVVTSVLLLACIGIMLWFKLRKKEDQRAPQVEDTHPTSLQLRRSASRPASSRQPQAPHEGSGALKSPEVDKAGRG